MARLEAGETAADTAPSRSERRDWISVIVPVTERPAPLAELYEEYAEPLRALERPFEFLFVTPPWYVDLSRALQPLRERGEPVRVIRVGAGFGEGTLLQVAAEHAKGELLLTLPAYYRVRAEAIGDLIAEVDAGADLAVAWRWPRRDSWLNRLQNLAFHSVLHGLVTGAIHDTACGVRAMRREVLREVPMYGDSFRFLPVLAMREGYRVKEVKAPQHERDTQPRLYSPGVYVRRLIDLLGLFFLTRFMYKPLRFFGLVGSLLSTVGGVILAVVLAQRLHGQALAGRPILLLGVLVLTLGMQAFALGLIGEIIVHLNARSSRGYRLHSSPDELE